MTFTPKQKALGATIALILISIAVGLGIHFIAENVSPRTLMYGAGLFIFVMLFNLIYQIFLSKFNFDENWKKSVDQK